MQLRPFWSVYWLLGFSLLACFLVFFSPIGDPDFWWHLRLGNDMLSGHGIPHNELYSWSMYGRPFVDFYWLSEIIIANLLRLFSHIGLSAFFAFLASTVLFLRLYGIEKRFGWRSFIVMMVFAFAFVTVTGVRPVTFSWFFFVLLLLLIERINTLSYGKVFFSSLMLFIVWVNMHDGFVLPVLYVGLLVFIHGLFYFFYWLKQPWAPKPIYTIQSLGKLCMIILTAGIALFLTPYGLAYVQTIIHEGLSVHNKTHIDEWQSLLFAHQLGLLYFTISLITAGLAGYQKRLSTQQAILLFMMFVIGASGTVHAPFFLLLIMPVLLQCLTTIPFPKQQAVFFKTYAFAVLTTASISFCFLRWQNGGLGLPQNALFPYRAVQAAKQLPPMGKMYNEYAWGGYLIYTLPEYPVFIDGRMASWKQGDAGIIEDLVKIDGLSPGFDKLLDKYKPDWFFIRTDRPLTQWLKRQPEYTVAYEDDRVSIIVQARKASEQ